jgi:predicted small lipoprotein YifL
MSARTFLPVTVAVLSVAGCGYKGQLTLPEKPGEVTTRPGPAGANPSAPEAPPPETAPGEVTTRTGGSGG